MSKDETKKIKEKHLKKMAKDMGISIEKARMVANDLITMELLRVMDEDTLEVWDGISWQEFKL